MGRTKHKITNLKIAATAYQISKVFGYCPRFTPDDTEIFNYTIEKVGYFNINDVSRFEGLSSESIAEEIIAMIGEM